MSVEKMGRLQAAQMNVPARFSSFRGLVPAASVASSNRTR